MSKSPAAEETTNATKSNGEGTGDKGKESSENSKEATQGVGASAPNTETKKKKSHNERSRIEIAAKIAERIETREAVCRAIQFSAKLMSGGGVVKEAHDIDASIGSSRKVFWLLKSLNELDNLRHASKDDGWALKLLFQSKCSLMGSFYLLDNLIWAARLGLYKNKQHTDLLEFASLCLFLGGSAVGCANELFSSSSNKSSEAKPKKRVTKERLLGVTKYGLNAVVAVGMLPLEKKIVPPRVTGACGLASALITLFEVYRSQTSSPLDIDVDARPSSSHSMEGKVSQEKPVDPKTNIDSQATQSNGTKESENASNSTDAQTSQQQKAGS